MKTGKRDRLNNEGFSLVELIIVISIMTVLSTAFFVSLAMLTGWRANEGAKKFVSYLSDTKTQALGRDDCKLTLSWDPTNGTSVKVGTYTATVSGGNLGDNAETSNNTHIICNKAVTLKAKVVTKSGAVLDDQVISSEATIKNITFSFDRASGAFKALEANGAPWRDGAGNDYYIESLTFTQGSKSTTVKFVAVTGKFYVE